MNFLFYLAAAAGGLTIGLVLLGNRRARRAATNRRIRLSGSEVRVFAAAPSPTRDLAATLPRRDAERRARLDRHFAYESARRPSYRADLDEKDAERLRPSQIVRVKSAAERTALQASAPAHLRLVFVDEKDPSLRATVPLPRPQDEHHS